MPRDAGPVLTVELAGGRSLAYAERGSPAGRPVVFFGGMPGSRLYGGQLHAAALDAGFRVIAPDLPGHGWSGFQPGRTFRSSAGNVDALADHLGFDRFDVVGAAGGAPHALACGLGCEKRVGMVVLANPALPPDLRPSPASPSVPQQALAWAARTPWANRTIMALVSAGARRAPGFVLKQMQSGAPPSDLAVLARPEVQELVTAAAADAFRAGGRGPAHEMALSTLDWGLPLDEVPVPVRILQGQDDPFVSREGVDALASAIPSTTVTYLPDAGAMWLFDRAGVVFETILAAG